MNTRVRLRRFSTSLLWVLAILVLAIAVNWVGIHFAGDVKGWSDWLDGHRLYFFVWRLCLYGATAYGWRQMRRRVLRRESSDKARSRLRRVEVAAVLTVLALEATVLLQAY